MDLTNAPKPSVPNKSRPISRAADLKTRSLAEWSIRGAAAATIGIAGYLGVTHSLAMALPQQALDRAHRLSPDNALVSAELSRQQLASEISAGGADKTRLAEPERLARQALLRDATAIPAVTTLGLIAQLRGDTNIALRRFTYAEQLSRRDLPTQLWLMENAVSRENIAQALRHYDTALRTKRSAPDLLFPVLATASTDPAIARELVRTLGTAPAWGPAFLLFLATKTPDPRATAVFFMDLSRAGIPVVDSAKAVLINALVGAEQFETAWRYYATVRPGAQRGYSRDGRFSASLESPSVFDWIPTVGETGTSVTIQRSGKGGVLHFTAPPTIGGQIVQQTQVLPPGRYVIEGHSSEINQPAGSQPYWVLTCRIGNRELGKVEVPNSNLNGGRFFGRFTVPQDCAAQDLILVARPSDAVEGLTGQIDSVQLRPMP
jgi:hypothetical protein